MKDAEYNRLLSSIVRKLDKAHIPMVAEATGLSDKGLRMIASGEVARPRVHTLLLLEDYFKG